MSTGCRLWAVVFEDVGAAERLREEIRSLQKAQCLVLEDVAIVTHLPDGSFRLERDLPSGLEVAGGCTLVGFLAGLVVGQPLVGAAAGALMGTTVVAAATQVGLSEEFVREVVTRTAPGATILFVMDEWGDREAVLHHVGGLGGTVISTNVDPEWMKQVQAALNRRPPATVD